MAERDDERAAARTQHRFPEEPETCEHDRAMTDPCSKCGRD